MLNPSQACLLRAYHPLGQPCGHTQRSPNRSGDDHVSVVTRPSPGRPPMLTPVSFTVFFYGRVTTMVEVEVAVGQAAYIYTADAGVV